MDYLLVGSGFAIALAPKSVTTALGMGLNGLLTALLVPALLPFIRQWLG